MQDPARQMMSKLQFERKLGEGGMGTVFLYRHKFSQKLYAVKCTEVTQVTKKHVKRAIDMCQRCYHPNILSYYGHVFHDDFAYLVFEFMPGGDLKSSVIRKRSPVPFEVLVRWVRQLVAVLVFLRRKAVLHRDIKPANVLLSSEDLAVADVKLADFDTCRNMLLQSDAMTRGIGTGSYMAPDVRNSSDYTSAVDVWSLGCLVFELATFKLPFSMTSESRDSQQRAGPVFPPHPQLPDVLKHFIRHCLVYEADCRPSAEQLLLHPLLSPKKPLPPLAQPPNEELCELPEQQELAEESSDEDEEETGFGRADLLPREALGRAKQTLSVDVDELRKNIFTIFEKQAECILIFSKIASPAEVGKACQDARNSVALTRRLVEDAIACRNAQQEETAPLVALFQDLEAKQEELLQLTKVVEKH